MLSSDAFGIRRGKTLRRSMSLPEVLLWNMLKTRPDGLKFRRQHPAGRYVLDFYCDAAKLCVEVDGISHDMGDRPPKDAERDEWLAMQGIRTLRIPAALVLSDLEAAITMILETAKSSP